MKPFEDVPMFDTIDKLQVTSELAEILRLAWEGDLEMDDTFAEEMHLHLEELVAEVGLEAVTAYYAALQT